MHAAVYVSARDQYTAELPVFLGQRKEQEFACAGLVTTSSSASRWALLKTEEQLRELLLYLCIWGESANLRFMPSLVSFLFEIARAHASSTLHHIQTATDNEFLETIVKPLYEQLAKEADANKDKDYFHFRNYDDLNEAFWSMRSICALRIKGAQKKGVMDAAPGQRYVLLQQADWAAWFDPQTGGAPKRHRENVWWSSLLVANRRIFLLHAVGFALLVLIAFRIDYPGWVAEPNPECPAVGQCEDQWGWWWAGPWILTMPSLAGFIGRFYEYWLHQVGGKLARMRNAFLTMLSHLTLASLVFWAQTQLSLCEYRCHFFADWFGVSIDNEDGRQSALTGLHAVAFLLLMFLSLILFVQILLVPTPPLDFAFDAQLNFEQRTENLRQASLFGKLLYTWGKPKWVALEMGVDTSRRLKSKKVNMPAGVHQDAISEEEEADFTRFPCFSLLLRASLPFIVAILVFLLTELTVEASYLLTSLVAVLAAVIAALIGLTWVTQCKRSVVIAPAFTEAVRMYLFWGLVWICKIAFVRSGISNSGAPLTSIHIPLLPPASEPPVRGSSPTSHLSPLGLRARLAPRLTSTRTPPASSTPRAPETGKRPYSTCTCSRRCGTSQRTSFSRTRLAGIRSCSPSGAASRVWLKGAAARAALSSLAPIRLATKYGRTEKRRGCGRASTTSSPLAWTRAR